MRSGALVLILSHPSCSYVAILLNPQFLTATIRLSPVPCPMAHLPPHETCPRRPPPPPPPPKRFCPLAFPSTVQKTCRFRRSSSNDGIFHVADNGENSQTRDFDDPYLAIECSDRGTPGADGDGKGRTHWDNKWQARIVPVISIKRGATRGLPRRSPILVLLSPKHA